MTVEKITNSGEFELAVSGDPKREITSVYCCDLLSVVMGRAKADCAWITVMGGLNSIAVSALADMSCIILAENMPLDEAAKAKAESHDIAVFKTALPVFEAATKIYELMR